MTLTLTDETYSVLCSLKYPDDVDEQKVDFYIASLCHLLCIFSCTIGALFLFGPDNFIIPALSVSLIVLVVMKDRISICDCIKSG